MLGFASEEDLEEFLSRPSEADLEAVRQLPGDFVILGAGGKMGPTLAMRIRRALHSLGSTARVIAISRFSDRAAAQRLLHAGIEMEELDLLDPSAALPHAPNVLFLAGRKFGSSGQAGLTWMMNVVVPARVAAHFRASRIAVLSSGNVYPLRALSGGGADESVEPAPLGEYAQTVLGRERVFEHSGASCIILRLNYAVEPRYGVLTDLALKIAAHDPIHLSMPAVNLIWQGEANSAVLRSLLHTRPDAPKLNLTGLETLFIEDLARGLASRLELPVSFTGTPAPTALLNDARQAAALLGPPIVSIEQMLDWTAAWIRDGGRHLNKPTHFETRDGKF